MAKPPRRGGEMRGLYPVFQVTELAAGYRDTTRQGHAVLSGHRSAEALLPPGGRGRPPYQAGQGDRTGADARRDAPGHPAGAAGTPRRPPDGQPVSDARSAAAAAAHAGGAQARAAARESGAAVGARLRRPALDRFGNPGPAQQPAWEPGSVSTCAPDIL